MSLHLPATPLPAGLPAHLGEGRLIGEAQLRWLGFPVYVARLWARKDFDSRALGTHPFALELHYLRDLRARDIARRSIVEMRRGGPIDDDTAARWEAALAKVIPDVKTGDRITGIHRPGKGASFLVNGKPAGDIDDAAFATRFFAIWLGTATSEPLMRESLLGGAAK